MDVTSTDLRNLEMTVLKLPRLFASRDLEFELKFVFKATRNVCKHEYKSKCSELSG